MFGRKRSLARTLQRRYFVDDVTEFVFWAFIILGAVLIAIWIFGGLLALADVGSTPWIALKAGFGLIAVGTIVLFVGRTYIDYSHWADQQAVKKGRAITWGQHLKPNTQKKRA